MQIIYDTIKEVSVIGSSPIIFALVGVVVLFFAVRRDYLRVFFVIMALGSGIYSTIIKALFAKERPVGYVSDGFIPWEQLLKSEVYSFPSTHVVLYTAFFGYLVYLSYKIKGVDKIIRHTLRIIGATMVAFVGASRVLLGAHYVRDVIAGYFFGLIYLGFLIAGEKLLEQKLLNTLPKRKKR